MNIRASSSFKPGNVSALQQAITGRVIKAVTKGSEVVMTEAKAIVPVDTGELQSSIGYQVELRGPAVEGTIFASAPHAAFIEFGTGLRGSASDHGELPTEGVPYSGAWIYDFRGQGWVGMPAKPYLRPALDTSHGAILDAFRQEGFKV
ncbi:MAG TPA: HK97-gp10 family putative phage morphogenesis protein [Candidatus Sulfotelmatobacter sp.]|nr:HK97-gp10 family putative phage morphogenesis protein [Candidatus Sulfotelmatobacter sp.]